MKILAAACAMIWTIGGCSTLASAQQWEPWDGPRRPPPDVAPSDDRYGDDRYDDYDRYDRGDDNRYEDRGYPDRRYQRAPNSSTRDEDPRRYDPRYNGDDAYRSPDRDRDEDDRYSAARRPDDQRYYDGFYGDGRGYGAWDAAPSPDEEQRLSTSPGSDGGQRPYIRAVAPPIVPFSGPYAAGSVIIDTGGRKLYYVINASSAYSYPIAVGRQGFTWTGKEKVSRVSDWPDWYPPADMRKRKPELPERMLGGVRNPLGAKAIYLGNTLYRIHGTNDPKSIGKAESSGCFRMLNENVLHLASLVRVGTEVTVVRSLNGNIASAAKTPSSKSRANNGTSARRWTDDGPYSEGWH